MTNCFEYGSLILNRKQYQAMLIHPMPDPVALKLGPFSVRWYGLMYLFAYVQASLLGRLRLKQPHIRDAGWVTKNLDDLIFYAAFGVIIGGRLGEVFFYNPAYFLNHPLRIFAIWEGGMSYHGGCLGVFCAMWFFAKKNKKKFIETLDFGVPLVPLGYAAGRLGNFINAELHGRIADPSLPWAMIWPNVDLLPRHPSPIYQALVNGILVFILLWLFARKPRKPGAVFAFYILLYGISRFITEYFRTPDYEVLLGFFTISAGQMLSIPMVIIASIWLGILYGKQLFQKNR